jgi:hypothetical protein
MKPMVPVGASKLARYGEEVIDLVSTWTSDAGWTVRQRYLRDTYTYKSHFNAQHDRHAAAYPVIRGLALEVPLKVVSLNP